MSPAAATEFAEKVNAVLTSASAKVALGVFVPTVLPTGNNANIDDAVQGGANDEGTHPGVIIAVIAAIAILVTLTGSGAVMLTRRSAEKSAKTESMYEVVADEESDQDSNRGSYRRFNEEP